MGNRITNVLDANLVAGRYLNHLHVCTTPHDTDNLEPYAPQTQQWQGVYDG